jgi:hypothetical protein
VYLSEKEGVEKEELYQTDSTQEIAKLIMRELYRHIEQQQKNHRKEIYKLVRILQYVHVANELGWKKVIDEARRQKDLEGFQGAMRFKSSLTNWWEALVLFRRLKRLSMDELIGVRALRMLRG